MKISAKATVKTYSLEMDKEELESLKSIISRTFEGV